MTPGSGESAEIRRRLMRRLESGEVLDAQSVSEIESVPITVADYCLKVLEQEGSIDVAEVLHEDGGRSVRRRYRAKPWAG